MPRKAWVMRWYVGYLDFRLRGLAQPDSIAKAYGYPNPSRLLSTVLAIHQPLPEAWSTSVYR